MKRLNGNVRALEAALQQAPKILKAVRVDVAFNVFYGMVNYLVDVLIKSAIRAKIIGYQFRARCYVLSDRFVNDMLATARDYFNLDRAAVSFEQSHNGDLADKARLGSDLLRSLVLVHESGSAADERLIRFNLRARAAQLLKGSGLHRESDSVHQEPSRLLGYAKTAMDFIRTDSVLRADDHPDGSQPLVEADRRIFHDRSELDREHLFALFVLALPCSAGRYIGILVRATARATDTIRPAQRDHKVERVVRVVEINDCLLKRSWEAVLGCCFHTQIVS